MGQSHSSLRFYSKHVREEEQMITTSTTGEGERTGDCLRSANYATGVSCTCPVSILEGRCPYIHSPHCLVCVTSSRRSFFGVQFKLSTVSFTILPRVQFESHNFIITHTKISTHLHYV